MKEQRSFGIRLILVLYIASHRILAVKADSESPLAFEGDKWDDPDETPDAHRWKHTDLKECLGDENIATYEDWLEKVLN